jgi:hypothetical protein
MKRTLVFLSLALVLTVTAFAQTGQIKSAKAACGACSGSCSPACCQHSCGDCCKGK